jgi:hypothetical protein
MNTFKNIFDLSQTFVVNSPFFLECELEDQDPDEDDFKYESVSFRSVEGVEPVFLSGITSIVEIGRFTIVFLVLGNSGRGGTYRKQQ